MPGIDVHVKLSVLRSASSKLLHTDQSPIILLAANYSFLLENRKNALEQGWSSFRVDARRIGRGGLQRRRSGDVVIQSRRRWGCRR